jgi:membrane protein DedA with SNARE-associated domain
LHDLIQRLVVSYQHSLQTGGYPYIVFLMALESSVVPLPSELVIPPAVLLVSAGQSSMSYIGITFAAAIGSWVGASVMYWASRIAGRPLLLKLFGFGARLAEWVRRVCSNLGLSRLGALLAWIIGHIFVTPEKLERAERWSQRFGSFGIFLSRMLLVVRHLIGIPAGIIRMNFLKYSVYTFLGSLFWCTVLVYVSFIAGKDERLMHGEFKEMAYWATGFALVVGSSYYFLVHRLSRKTA